jgi:hypothetical protein
VVRRQESHGNLDHELCGIFLRAYFSLPDLTRRNLLSVKRKQYLMSSKILLKWLQKLLVVLCVYLILWAVLVYHTEMLFRYPLQGRAFPDIMMQNINLQGKHFLFRVNSLSRLRANMGRYDGYEMDVIFHNGKLLIGHDLKNTKDLSFENMLQSLPKPADHEFWLDLKNLEETNRSDIVNCLTYLIDSYALKDRIIVESGNISVLSRMRGRGFYTSYYLPFPNRYRPSENDAIQLAETLRKHPVDAVSSFGSLYPFMEHYFPHVTYLTWWWAPLQSFFYTGWIDKRLMTKPQVNALITKDIYNNKIVELVLTSLF